MEPFILAAFFLGALIGCVFTILFTESGNDR